MKTYQLPSLTCEGKRICGLFNFLYSGVASDSQCGLGWGLLLARQKARVRPLSSDGSHLWPTQYN